MLQDSDSGQARAWNPPKPICFLIISCHLGRNRSKPSLGTRAQTTHSKHTRRQSPLFWSLFIGDDLASVLRVGKALLVKVGSSSNFLFCFFFILMFSLKFGFLNFNFQIFCWVNDPNLSLRLHRQIKVNPSRWQFACLLFSSHEIDIMLVVEIHGKLYRPSRMVEEQLHFTIPPLVSSVACWEWGIVFTISLKVSFFIISRAQHTWIKIYVFIVVREVAYSYGRIFGRNICSLL